MKPPREADVHEFWRWFSSVSADLAANLDNAAILGELDARIARFGGITWEVGPGLQKPNALVISPGGREDLLAATRRIVDLAPDFREWEFHPAKPPKAWDLRFVVEKANGQSVDVDARDWRYVLLQFPDRTFDILVRTGNLGSVDPTTRDLAADLAVEGTLGEIRKMTHIGRVEAVLEFEKEHEGKSTSLGRLREHLDSLLK